MLETNGIASRAVRRRRRCGRGEGPRAGATRRAGPPAGRPGAARAGCRGPGGLRRGSGYPDPFARRAAAPALQRRQQLRPLVCHRGRARRGRRRGRAACRGAGDGGHRRHVRAGEPGGEVRLVAPAAGPCWRRGPALAECADADLHVIPVRSRGVGVRLRRGHRPGPALARSGAAVPGGDGGILPGAHRSALPGRHRGRLADRREYGAGRSRPDGPPVATPETLPIGSC
jgi:hypothetical protein